MQNTTALSNGTRRINKIATFCNVLHQNFPQQNTSVTEIINALDYAVRQEYPGVTREALSNAHGDWYEWLLAIAAWNVHINYKTKVIAVNLPNKSLFDCAELYTTELYDMIEHLRHEVAISSGVHLISSNPDFALVKAESTSILLPKDPITEISPKAIQFLSDLYKMYKFKCNFDDIRGC